MSEKYNSIVVIGRIAFDDEDSAYEFKNMTEDEAVTLFREKMWEDDGVIDPENDGRDIFINFVMTSESPIWMCRYN
jgi:hypothetical protein